MKIVTDHSTWCDECGEYLSTDNPGVKLWGKVLCLHCIERMRDALIAQAAEDKARER